MDKLLRRVGMALFLVTLAAGLGAIAQDPEPSEADAPAEEDYGEEPVWPRVIEENGVTLTVYQPQIDVFEDDVMEARAAVQVETKVGDKKQTNYGVVWIKAHPFVDKEAGVVQFDDIEITKANFPTLADKTETYLEILRRNTEQSRTISLERIEANLAITQADKKGNAVPLKNDPPRIYYRTSPALLLLIDGDPVLRPVEGSNLQRVINTRNLILQDGGSFFLPIADRWFQSPSITGPWQLAANVPPAAVALRDTIAKDENQTQVDLVEDPGEDVTAVLAKGAAPEIIVSTEPAELIVTQGKPQLKPVSGTQLLYVANTSGDILFYLEDQSYYVPLTGRWFRGKSLDGPWQFVEGDELPKDFARIPANDPKSSVLATVSQTPAAQEAVIANSIPQTAEVNRAETKFEPKYDGEPRFDDVPDTDLEYAVNSPLPVVRVSATSYYGVESGVWFTGGSPFGPWEVATVIPPVIYSIPTASPIHYVTYVKVYRYNPTYVWVGYTPGYMGTCYSPWGTVVYGTGWRYRPWIGTTWYGAPMTWGFGVGISWSPWTGWDVGFGSFGYRPLYRPWWGPYYDWRPRPTPYYAGRRPVVPGYGRPGYTRPAPIRINDINVYNRPGIVRPVARVRPGSATGSVRPAPRPGTMPARPNPSDRPATTRPGARPAPGTITRPSTRPAPSRPDNVYAGPDGNVYRPRPTGGWETRDSGRWKPVEPSRPETRPAPGPEGGTSRPAPRPSRPSPDPGTLNQLSRDRQGRQNGNTRMSPPPQRQAPPSRPAPQSRPAPSRPSARPN
jgi:hypothetical protein